MTSKLKTDVLETGSGSGTIALNNQLSGMTADSMPSGSVIQVVNKVDTSTYNTNSSTFVDSGLFIDITPQYANSKIHVTFSSTFYTTGTGQITIARNNVVDNLVSNFQMGASGVTRYMPCSVHHVDSPNSTSSTRYSIYFSAYGGSINIPPGSADVTQIIATEIKG